MIRSIQQRANSKLTEIHSVNHISKSELVSNFSDIDATLKLRAIDCINACKSGWKLHSVFKMRSSVVDDLLIVVRLGSGIKLDALG